MRKLAETMLALSENGFMDSASSVLYCSYLWVTFILWVVYTIDWLLALRGKRSKPSAFVGQDMRDIRVNNLAPLYKGLSNISMLNLIIAELLRHSAKHMGLQFSIMIPIICVAITGVAYMVNIIIFCKQHSVLPKFIAKLIYK